MKKLHCFFLFLITFSSTSICGQDVNPIKKRKNYIGVELLGSPLRLTYGRFFKTESNITQSYYVGLSPLALIGWPALHIGYRAEKMITNKFGLYSDVGLELLTVAFPIFFFQDKKLYGSADFKEISANQTFATIINYKRIMITPLFLRTTLNAKYIILEYGDEETRPSSPLFFSFGTNISYKF